MTSAKNWDFVKIMDMEIHPSNNPISLHRSLVPPHWEEETVVVARALSSSTIGLVLEEDEPQGWKDKEDTIDWWYRVPVWKDDNGVWWVQLPDFMYFWYELQQGKERVIDVSAGDSTVLLTITWDWSRHVPK